MRHRRRPPYEVTPRVREQGARFWAGVATGALLAVVFYGYFVTRAFESVLADHYDIIDTADGEKY